MLIFLSIILVTIIILSFSIAYYYGRLKTVLLLISTTIAIDLLFHLAGYLDSDTRAETLMWAPISLITLGIIVMSVLSVTYVLYVKLSPNKKEKQESLH